MQVVGELGQTQLGIAVAWKVVVATAGGLTLAEGFHLQVRRIDHDLVAATFQRVYRTFTKLLARGGSLPDLQSVVLQRYFGASGHRVGNKFAITVPVGPYRKLAPPFGF